uniref:Uncharacterized protein n=1 Tax=viral metagenome TaxID=1070528 RepID=A0A6H1ZLT2_9ZZZZ
MTNEYQEYLAQAGVGQAQGNEGRLLLDGSLFGLPNHWVWLDRNTGVLYAVNKATNEYDYRYFPDDPNRSNWPGEVPNISDPNWIVSAVGNTGVKAGMLGPEYWNDYTTVGGEAYAPEALSADTQARQARTAGFGATAQESLTEGARMAANAPAEQEKWKRIIKTEGSGSTGDANADAVLSNYANELGIPDATPMEILGGMQTAAEQGISIVDRTAYDEVVKANIGAAAPAWMAPTVSPGKFDIKAYRETQRRQKQAATTGRYTPGIMTRGREPAQQLTAGAPITTPRKYVPAGGGGYTAGWQNMTYDRGASAVRAKHQARTGQYGEVAFMPGVGWLRGGTPVKAVNVGIGGVQTPAPIVTPAAPIVTPAIPIVTPGGIIWPGEKEFPLP